MKSTIPIVAMRMLGIVARFLVPKCKSISARINPKAIAAEAKQLP
jgi:hypothetical protein